LFKITVGHYLARGSPRGSPVGVDVGEPRECQSGIRRTRADLFLFIVQKKRRSLESLLRNFCEHRTEATVNTVERNGLDSKIEQVLVCALARLRSRRVPLSVPELITNFYPVLSNGMNYMLKL
jgi:hypothetical protein